MTKPFNTVRNLLRRARRAIRKRRTAFRSSSDYWRRRYRDGGSSGAGSEGPLAEFKAEVVNRWLDTHGILSVIELGCGDGRQAALCNYRHYHGFDVRPHAVRRCRERFEGVQNWRFDDVRDYSGQTAEAAVSLDVIYHVVEDQAFHRYMEDLTSASEKYLIVYSTNDDTNPPDRPPHIRHRRFTDWLDKHAPDFELVETVQNPYAAEGAEGTQSSASFYLFRRKANP